MFFNWRGRRFSTPISIKKGVLPCLVEEEEEESESMEDVEDNEAFIQYAEEEDHGYRILTQEERTQLQEYNMRTTRCPFCSTKIYYAEMMCSCPETKNIPRNMTLQEHLPVERPPKKQKKWTAQNVPEEIGGVEQ